jgi:hypothetical protein
MGMPFVPLVLIVKPELLSIHPSCLSSQWKISVKSEPLTLPAPAKDAQDRILYGNGSLSPDPDLFIDHDLLSFRVNNFYSSM